jgi:hypothetical protein
MRTKLVAIAVLATAAVTLVAVASAGSVAAKQRITIQTKGSCGTSASTCPAVLTPLTAGAVKADTGTAVFCCWTQRFVTRNGQSIEIDNPLMTFTGKRSTLVIRKQIDWVDLPDGYAISTGTWKVVRGTGDYAKLSGSGQHAGLQFPSGDTKWVEEGFVVSN